MDKVNIGVEASSWINIVAGLAIAGIAWYETASFDQAFYSGVVSGALLVLAGVWTAYDGARNTGRNSTWVSAACVLIGAWIFAYPWFVELSNVYFWTSMVVGVGVVLVSGYEAYAAMSKSAPKGQKPTV